MTIEMTKGMEAERPRLLRHDPRTDERLFSMAIQNPPSEFVDAIRICLLNRASCSFLPNVPESADIVEMQETADRGGRHELYLSYIVKHRAGTA